MLFEQRCRLLNHYFFASYIVVLVLCSSYLTNIQYSDGRTVAFAAAAYLSYGFIYLLPALLVTKLLHRLLSLGRGDCALPRGSMVTVYLCAVATMALTDTAIFADRTIYALYGFHLNGFVWNLLMTPGGIESLGGSRASEATYGAIIISFFLLQACLLWALAWLYRRHLQRSMDSAAVPKKHYRLAVVLFLLLTVGERVAYGISHVQAYTPVLVAAQSLPLYTPTTFRRFAKSLGYEMQRQSAFKLDVKSASLAYPLNPIEVAPPEKPLNIVWLVAESWRYDMLDPEIMPATWAFAQKANRFTQHYSGGNCTRMGMYTMFYGLYGAYWFAFLDERRTPLIMDQLQQQNYQLSLYTSAKFSYPEFDKTLFAKIP
ncbi:MAG: DUF3413 domain-containing protein, partial [Gammaproteobacteria bacterium]|nr:DUF3413 domain-containing protein [Gammaproteobacteria bacterium]